jgi:rhodanese-related sulfurtransferase/DNA-binding transcriptional ArsR family regulator
MAVKPKQAVYEQFARIGKALSSPARLELLELLAQGERTVDTLAQLSGLAVANTSQHLQHLRRAGLVEARKEGLYVHYRLRGDEVVHLVGAVQVTGQAYLAEVDKLLREFFLKKDELEPLDAGELLERSRRRLVTVIDVRPPEEFAAGHLPGAINIPIDDLKQRLGELPRRKEVIAYCRGPYCLMSFDAVVLLRTRGYKARRLEAGLPEWRAKGLPVEGVGAHS